MFDTLCNVYWVICSIAAGLFMISVAVDAYESNDYLNMLLWLLLSLTCPFSGYFLAVGSVILCFLSIPLGILYGLVVFLKAKL